MHVDELRIGPGAVVISLYRGNSASLAFDLSEDLTGRTYLFRSPSPSAAPVLSIVATVAGPLATFAFTGAQTAVLGADDFEFAETTGGADLVVVGGVLRGTDRPGDATTSVLIPTVEGALITLTGSLPGPPGATGPAGPPGSGTRYEHVQASPAGSWPVNHGLGYLPNITVFDLAGSVVLADVTANVLTATVVHATPAAGVAVLT